MTKLSTKDLVVEIVKEQSLVIGTDLAISRALHTGVITFSNNDIDSLELLDSSPSIFNNLVDSYEALFGTASVEVCLNVFRKHTDIGLSRILPKNLVSSL